MGKTLFMMCPRCVTAYETEGVIEIQPADYIFREDAVGCKVHGVVPIQELFDKFGYPPDQTSPESQIVLEEPDTCNWGKS